MLDSSKKKSIKSMLLNSVKRFLEYLIGLISKTEKSTSTQITTQPGVGSNITVRTATQNLRSLTTEESIDATIASYCSAMGITEQDMTIDEYTMICNLVSLYAHQPVEKTSC